VSTLPLAIACGDTLTVTSLADAADENKGAFRPLFILLGIAIAVAIQFAPHPEGLNPEAWLVVSLAALMVTWWITEAIPIPATSLLPLIFLPATGLATMQQAAAPYADQTIMLLLGGSRFPSWRRRVATRP
jgi:solute carrier family 13 (sodium-dependent dicarboxylate transporter), member 2/3/5